MTLEQATYYADRAKKIASAGNSILLISVIQWPVKPFDAIEYYMEFKMFTNLYASEKLSELTIERFFECCDTMLGRKEEYQEWKRTELSDAKISSIIE